MRQGGLGAGEAKTRTFIRNVLGEWTCQRKKNPIKHGDQGLEGRAIEITLMVGHAKNQQKMKKSKTSGRTVRPNNRTGGWGEEA